MKKKFKLFIISLFLVFGYLVLVSYPYFFSKIDRFNSLGTLSLVEEKSVYIPKTEPILKGEKITAEIKATENNLGIVLVRFVNSYRHLVRMDEEVVFRLRQRSQKDWYYEHAYRVDQFQPNEYFTFGFPTIANSKNKIYIFEIESVRGKTFDATSISPKKPQVALIYKYTRGDLSNFNTLSPFIFKKFVYAARNADFLQNWHLLAAFVLFFLLVLFMEKKKIKVVINIRPSTSVRYLQAFKTSSRSIFEVVIHAQKSNYLSAEKKIVKFSKKTAHSFTSTKFYLLFLKSNAKKRIVISLLIFLIAFLYRFSATLVDQMGVSLFYDGLGGQGDYDQFIRAATCALKFCPAILGQNFLIESSILGVFYEIFGFTGALKAYLYLMIILSSIVATLPYALLSRKHFLTIGGIIGSLYLSTSDYLTHMALNFPPDNGSVFLFSIFFIVYLFTINIGTIRWLLLLGLMGIIDGLNKLTMLINDLAVLILFIPIFFYEKAKRIKKFPFLKFDLKLIFYSIVPLLVFIVIYSAWEYIVQIKFSTPYYLRALIEGGSTYESSTIQGVSSLNESLSKGNILEKLYYYAGLSIVMLKRLIENAGLNDIFLTPILLGLLFTTLIKPLFDNLPFGELRAGRARKFFIAKLISIIVFASLAIAILILFRQDFLHIQDIGQYVYAWSDDLYVNVFLFASIIFLFILNFRYQAFKLALPIMPYAVMLIILAKNAPEARLLVHVIAWSIILSSFLIDWILRNDKKNILKRLWIGPAILILFISFYTVPKLSIMAGKLAEGYNNNRNEVKYLKWVNLELPENAIILAGGKSDVVTIVQNLKRPIVYNTQWTGALLIKPNEIPRVKPTDFAILDQLKINEMRGVTLSDFSLVQELKNKDNFKKNKYLILEDDIYIWRNRLSGIADAVFAADPKATLALHAGDFSIKVYKFNSALNEGIYELTNTRN